MLGVVRQIYFNENENPMHIQSYAFKENEDELRDRNIKRYKEIQHLGKTMEITRTPKYGRGVFKGVLKTDEEKALSEFDLALIADHGNLCFGGSCTKSGDAFSGHYFTD